MILFWVCKAYTQVYDSTCIKCKIKIDSVFACIAQFDSLYPNASPCSEDTNITLSLKQMDTLASWIYGRKNHSQGLNLETFEDNFIGTTWDSDDRVFMDFTVSLVYELFNFARYADKDIAFKFAFTGRLGQYIGTRYSSPVVGKRFNPYFFFEYRPACKNMFMSLGYGHESNGQSIDDSVTFMSSANSANSDEHQSIDYISRGWDYIGLGYLHNFHLLANCISTFNGSLRAYLNNGLLQGPTEGYRVWERDWYGKRYARNEVSGISGTLIADFVPRSNINSKGVRIKRIKLGYETGIMAPFLTNSFKCSITVNAMHVPLTFSYSNGYNGDLAQYGIRNNSFSVGLLLSSFDFPWMK